MLSRESKTTGLFKVVGLEHEYMGKSFKALAVKVGEMRKEEEEEKGEAEEEKSNPASARTLSSVEVNDWEKCWCISNVKNSIFM